MKQPTRITIALLACGLLFAVAAAAGDEKSAGSETAPGADMAAMEAAMMEAMTPGEQHAFLGRMAGDWTFKSMMWVDPSQPPMTSQGKSRKSMIMDGRYLQEETSGEMMGQPFHGQGVTAYDKAAGEFVNSWVDTMSTGILVSRGSRDGDTLTFTGNLVDPMSKQEMDVKLVTRLVDDDHHVFQFFMTPAGAPELKAIEIEYTRAFGE
jgi:hypothetical protein